jgi:hypothetical protein
MGHGVLEIRDLWLEISYDYAVKVNILFCNLLKISDHQLLIYEQFLSKIYYKIW